MDTVILVLILLGSAIMVNNVVWYIRFLFNSHDMITTASYRDVVWRWMGLILLVFFLIGYLVIALFLKPDLLMALILFFGSAFVTILLVLMFRLLDTVKTRGLDIADVLVSVIDARDPNLNGHSIHVQRLTMLIYSHMPPAMKRGISPTSLQYAALMHDIGKLGVPEAILNKPAKLNDEEWTLMRRHPEIGVKLLRSIHAFDEIDDWIHYHHERMDGKGYYARKEGEIPFASKIIAVADTFSAITMRRSYKAPRSYEEAVEVLKEVAGTQLDPQIVDIFLAIPREEVMACEPEEIRY